jgi:hypothetical protein
MTTTRSPHFAVLNLTATLNLLSVLEREDQGEDAIT